MSGDGDDDAVSSGSVPVSGDGVGSAVSSGSVLAAGDGDGDALSSGSALAAGGGVGGAVSSGSALAAGDGVGDIVSEGGAVIVGSGVLSGIFSHFAYTVMLPAILHSIVSVFYEYAASLYQPLKIYPALSSGDSRTISLSVTVKLFGLSCI